MRISLEHNGSIFFPTETAVVWKRQTLQLDHRQFLQYQDLVLDLKSSEVNSAIQSISLPRIPPTQTFSV